MLEMSDSDFKGVIKCCLLGIIRHASKGVVYECELLEMIRDLASSSYAFVHTCICHPYPNVQGVLQWCVSDKLTENRSDETNIVSWDGAR